MYENLNVVFIGGGNMGQALAGGLIESGWQPACITIIDSDQHVCAQLEKLFPNCHVLSQTEAALNVADIVVLAVKPQVMLLACEEMAEACQAKRPLIISIAAGVKIDSVDEWLGGQLPIVRCMPNTPALVQAGITGMFASPEASDLQREMAESVMQSVGSTIWLDDEPMLDIVTAVSGSGPAYFFYLIETMIETGQALGLTESQARKLTIDTAKGAAKLIEETGKSAQELRHAVTSKGGTTEAALETLNNGDVKSIIRSAIINAAKKAKQLAQAKAPINSK